MKSLVIFSVISLFVAASAQNQFIVQISQNCKSEVGASDDDVSELASGKAPKTPAGKCLINCVGVEQDIIIDNKINESGFTSAVGLLAGSDKTDVAKEIAGSCADVTDDEKCKAAFDIWTCVEDESKKRGVDFFNGSV